MAMKCDLCLKGVLYGHNVSHSKRRTQKIFKPNLHTARIQVGTNKMKMKLCTKCLRLWKKSQATKASVTETPSPATA